MNQPPQAMREQPDPESAAMTPSDLVRTEAAALEALATRLEGSMAEPFRPPSI